MLFDMIRQGLPAYRAAAVVGVSRSCVYMRRERDEEFKAKLEEAEANAESLLLDAIYKASSKTWFAAAWILERRWPERWSSPADKLRRKELEAKKAEQPGDAVAAAVELWKKAVASIPEGSDKPKEPAA